MANVYYKIDGSTTYYCNEQKSGYYLRRDNDVTTSQNKTVVVELTNDKFILPENSNYLFAHARNENYSNVENWDTSGVTSMYCLFEDNAYLRGIDVSHFDTSNVTNMAYMFGLNRVLEYAYGTWLWNTSKVESFEKMFYDCYSLYELSVGSWDTSSCTNMCDMFYGCEGLEDISVRDFDVSHVTNFNNMFSGCKNLRAIYARENTDWSLVAPANATSVNMFYDTQSIPRKTIHGDLSAANNTKPNGRFSPYNTWFTNDVVYEKNEGSWKEVTDIYIAYADREVEPINKKDVPLSDVYYRVDGNLLYYTNEEKDGYTLLTPGTGSSIINYDKTVIIELYNDMFVLPENSDGLFSTARNTSYNNTDKWVTSNVKNMSSLFDRNTNLTSLDFIENWDTSKVTNMYGMFYGCTNIKSLNLQDWYTTNVTSMSSMFAFMIKLETLNISNFDTSKVTSMTRMFAVDDGYTSKLKTIYASELFTLDSIVYQSNMFANCTALVGGNGTTYDSSHTDGLYARIDKQNSPGYFTYRTPRNTWCKSGLIIYMSE